MKWDFRNSICFAPDGDGADTSASQTTQGTGDGGESGGEQGAVDGAASTGTDGESGPVSTSTETPPEPTVPLSVFNKRLSQVTAARSRAEAEAAELRARIEAGQTPAGQTQPTVTPPATVSPVDVERAADQLLIQREFNAKCNEIMQNGVKSAQDFTVAVDTLKGAAGGAIPRPFLEAAIELDSPHEVLYALGKDLGRAMQIMELSPARQAIALAKIETELKAKKATPPLQSRAPAPITPVVGGSGAAPTRGSVKLDDPKTSMEDWIREREKEVEANSPRRRRG